MERILTVKEVKTHFKDGSKLALRHKAVLSAIFRSVPGFGSSVYAIEAAREYDGQDLLRNNR